MNCKHCGSRWDVAPELASKMTTCPFCNQPLIEKKVYPLTTIEGVLQQIVIQQGEEVLYSGSRMTAFFADIAPKMIRERRLVRIFTDSNAHKTILSARNSEEDVRRKSYEQAVLRLQDDYYIAESAARMMCRAFYLAVYGESIEEPQKPEAVSPSPQPAAAPAKPRFAAASAEQQPVAVPVNNPEACYTYAKAYETGGTVDGRKLPADMDKAIKFYETAANMGHTKSQIRLGELYYSHLKVKRDLKASARWYTKAALKNNVEAMLGLLQVYKISGEDGQYFHWATRLAEWGNPQGQLTLGRCYRDGVGVAANVAKARYYLDMAARSIGDASVSQTARQELNALSPAKPAAAAKGQASGVDTGKSAGECYNHARIYEKGGVINGRYVTADMGMAIELYEDAAQLGHTQSQIRLGELYYSHLKVKRDLKASARWYSMAAQENKVEAMLGLLQVYKISGENDQYAMWAARLAEMGNPQGQLTLGRCYRDGVGLPVNLTKARYYLGLAARSVGDASVSQTANQELNALNQKPTASPDDFVRNGKVLVKYNGTGSLVHIPAGIEEIGAFAFSNHQYVRSVVIPNTVKRIGTSAFQGCSNLRSVEMSSNVTHIESRAFSDCSVLPKITLPEGLQILGLYAFANCHGLLEISVPGKIKEVNPCTFQNCHRLKSVTLNYGIQYVGRHAFASCLDLELIRIPDSLLSVEEQAFVGCTKLHQFTASPAWRAVNSETLKRIIR